MAVNGWLTFQDLKTTAEKTLWRSQVDRPNQLATVAIGVPDPRSGASWSSGATVRAVLVRQILLGHGPDPRPAILRMEGARISGKLNLEAASLVCPLDLMGCYFDEVVNLQQTNASAIYLTKCNIPRGVRGDQLHTLHNLDLTGSEIGNGVMLRAARIEGKILFNGATVRPGGSGIALDLSSIAVSRGAYFNKFTAKGMAFLTGGEFGRSLKLEGAEFTKPHNSVSVRADRITVEGSLGLSNGFLAEGEVDLSGSRVKGSLGFSGGRFLKSGGTRGEEKVLDLTRVIVDQNAYFNNGFKATGTVSLLDGSIKGSLRCEGGEFHNATDTALNAAGIAVGRDITLTKIDTGPANERSGFSAQGKVIFDDATVGGKLDCSGGRFSNPGETAFTAEGMQTSRLVFGNGFQAEGSVNLMRVRVHGELRAGSSLRSDQILLDGLSYTSINDDMELGQRLAWLLRMESPNLPQVYRQLASVYQGQGRDSQAKKILVAGQRAHFATRKWPVRWLGFIFRRTVGYGYYPSLILIWLAALEVAGGVIFSCLRNDVLLAPIYINQMLDAEGVHRAVGTITGGSPTIEHGYPAFQPWLYTLDLLLPVVDLWQSEIWIPHRGAEWASMFFTIAGWALATCLVIGLGGVFARERQSSTTLGA